MEAHPLQHDVEREFLAVDKRHVQYRSFVRVTTIAHK